MTMSRHALVARDVVDASDEASTSSSSSCAERSAWIVDQLRATLAMSAQTTVDNVELVLNKADMCATSAVPVVVVSA